MNPQNPIDQSEKAIFAAGCFWGIEADFQNINGVISTRVGYTGGNIPNPSYQQVCVGNTHHAEAVEVLFTPAVISFAALLEHFWHMHDPTQYHQQGPDIGSQYRSAVFYLNADQQAVAEHSKKQAQQNYALPITTEITPASEFWPAEEYHQNYVRKRRGGVG